MPELARGIGAHATNAGLYPPGFYAAMHTLADQSVTASVMWMRVANAALAMLVIGLAFAVTEGRTRAAFALTVGLGFCAPLGLFFIPSTNPTAWSVIGIGSLWLFVLTFLSTESRWRRWTSAAASVLAWSVAVGARADAPVLAALTVTATAVIATAQSKQLSLKLLMPVLLVAASGAAFLAGSGGTVASNGLTPAAAGGRGPDPTVAAQLAYNSAHPVHLLLGNVRHLWEYESAVFYTPRLGWGEIRTTHWGWIMSLVVLSALLGAAFLYRGWARAAYLALFAAGLAIPLVVMQQSHVVVSSGFVQPRYLYPLMVALLGLACRALVQAGWLSRLPWHRFVPSLWVAMTLISSLALHADIHRYEWSTSIPGLTADTHRSLWWLDLPLSPTALWLIGSAAMGATFALLLAIAARARGSESDVPAVGVSW